MTDMSLAPDFITRVKGGLMLPRPIWIASMMAAYATQRALLIRQLTLCRDLSDRKTADSL